LNLALDELLAGKSVSMPETAAAGCYIGKVQREKPHGEITYAKDVARILQKRCTDCHRAGSIAPFSLTSYGDAAGWAETISEVLHGRRMPPWDADPKYGHFANDPGMPDSEKDIIYQWVKNGAPEGDARDMPAPPKYTEGWRIPKPDLILSMPKPYTVPANGVLPYQYFIVDPSFKEDKWISAAEVRPGNSAVVHHVVVIVWAPGEPNPAEKGGIGDFVAVGVPGMWPRIYPQGSARLVPAGSKLVFQMHYTPCGSVQTDQTKVGIVFADPKTVRRRVQSDLAINFKLKIPAGAADYADQAGYRFEQDALLYSVAPHMHVRGKSFRFDALYPDGTSEVLLDVPHYRFDWQNQYVLAEPKRMPEGTVIRCIGHFDNSAGNPYNPNPLKEVHFGEQTWDEMLVGFFDWAIAYQDLTSGPPPARRLPDGKYDVLFRFQAPQGTREVYLAGPFNDWKPTGRKMDGPNEKGEFTTHLTLPPGRHEYKFVVEGKKWRHDPSNPRQVGTYHNSELVLSP
jgi:hypothetical protein